jgi:hypothetical protein
MSAVCPFYDTVDGGSRGSYIGNILDSGPYKVICKIGLFTAFLDHAF